VLIWNPATDSLGVAAMDATHEEFIRLAGLVAEVGDEGLADAFDRLLAHTQGHFDDESRHMRACGFGALAEHEAEHRRVLAELRQMRRLIDSGKPRLARIYVKDGVPDWFRNHLATMDAALAACLKRSGPTASA
jgi:hemerythrin-like metal-binding protein